MATVTWPTNWLTTLAGNAIVNLQATPMLPYPNTGWVEHYDNPQVADGHVTASNTRHHYPSWPTGSVAMAHGGPLGNLLQFRCRSYERGTNLMSFIDTQENADYLYLGFLTTSNYESALWTSGDDLPYSQAQFYWNRKVGTQIISGQTYDDWTIDDVTYQLDSSGAFIDISRSTTLHATAPITTGDAFLGNQSSSFYGYDFTDIEIYATYSGQFGYDTALSDYGTTVDNYSSGNQVLRSVRQTSASAHGLSAYVESDYGDLNIKLSPAHVPDYRNGLYTLTFDPDAIFTQHAMERLVQGRWVYTPNGSACGPCWWDGKTVVVEAKFKKAPITITPASISAAEYYSIGSWSDHSTETFTLTLPASTSESLLGTDYNFPTQDGYVVALDDLRLVSVT